MVRTRGDNTGRRVVAAKAPRKQPSGGGSSSSNVLGSPGAKDKNSGGNPVRWTTTPSWQKGIGTFFEKPGDEDEQNSSTNENSPASNADSVSSVEDSTSAPPSNVEESSSVKNEITPSED